ncbi:hypothetical protein SRHO_G00248430 [Serrasalmus rhombeus]
MERSRAALIMCVLFSRISGAEVEMRVRPGDDVTLYSDCVWETGFNTVWFRNCSHEHQPRLLISTKLFMRGAFPRYFVVLNSSNQAHDLLVKNVTESDGGLYYCAIHKRKITEDNTGVLRNEDVYHYGNRTTRLSLLIPFAQTTPPISDCSVCWKLLVSLCPVCALLSSLLSSTCVYCICINKPEAEAESGQEWRNRIQSQKSRTNDEISAQTSASKTLTIIRPPAPVSEMERSRAVLMTLVCILFSRISGAEVKMRVRPGDDVTLYSDCVSEATFNIVWFKNSSCEHQPPLMISTRDLVSGAHPHYSAVWNPSNKTHDLLVKNVSDSDVGLYYCAVYEKNIKDEKGFIRSEDIYHYGKRTTRLSLLVPCTDLLQTPSTPPVSDCSVCWKLLVSVCPVCVLLSSTCVCCIYRHTKKGPEDGRELLAGTVFQVGCAEEHHCERTMNGSVCVHTEVCYASLKSALKSD